MPEASLESNNGPLEGPLFKATTFHFGKFLRQFRTDVQNFATKSDFVGFFASRFSE